MRRLRTIAVIGVAITVPLFAAAQEPVSKQVAARIELHPIQTLTISDQQFLKGDNNGKAVTISGQLRIAQGQGRLPVVLLVHGSGGIAAGIDVWSQEFNARGISTFVLDSFTGRGLTSVSTDQSVLGRLNMILDVYHALGILAKHPRVDPARIALMGFSRGGQATLYASLTRFQQTWNKSGVSFAAYVPFYPDCMTTYISDTELTGGPIRIFHGTADDYDPVAPCKAYMERLRAAGRDAQLTEYPNASHGFDNPLNSPTPAVARNAQTVRHCTIREEPLGLLINAATKEPFTYKDPCVELDPHTGYDPAASTSAKQAVKELLKTVFKLN